ncbi:unnamed protein product [Closterium sp. NIES-54]
MDGAPNPPLRVEAGVYPPSRATIASCASCAACSSGSSSASDSPCSSCSSVSSVSVGADDDVQDAEEGWHAEGDVGAEGGTEAATEAAIEAGTAEDLFPEGAPGGDDDDGVEYWSRDGLPEKLPIPTYPPRNRKRPHPSSAGVARLEGAAERAAAVAADV